MNLELDFFQNIIGLVFVGIIWGVTNPYMEKGTKVKAEGKEEEKIDFGWRSFIKTISNLKFLIPFGLNQSGSLLYYFLLGKINLSIAPLIVNSVNCMMTYITENKLKNQTLTKENQNNNFTLDSHTPFNSSNLTKEEERLFFGERVYENLQFNEFSPKKPLFEYNSYMFSTTIYQEEICCQKLLIPYQSKAKSFFDVFMMFFVAYSVFTNLFYTTFDTSAPEALDYFDSFIECCFGLEILSNFFSAYKDEESLEIVTDVWQISKKYIKGFFLLDLMAVFPFKLVNSGQNYLKLMRIIRLPRLLKILNERKIFNLIESIFQNLTLNDQMKYLYASKYIYRIFRLILIALTLLYFLACVWIAIVSICDESITHDSITGKYQCFAALQPSGDPYPFYSYDNIDKLVISCYFILTTLATVGYGDFYPVSQTEKIADIFIMLIGIAFFSYIMSNFTNFITNYNKIMGVENKMTDLEVWIDSLNMITNTPIPKEQMEKIYEEYEYFWKNNRMASVTMDDKYFRIIPRELKNELIKHLFYDVFFKDFRAFFLNRGREYVLDDFYIASAFSLLPKRYKQNEVIIRREEEFNDIVFVLEGEIELSFEIDGIKHNRFFTKGFYFGDHNIIAQKPCEFTYTVKKMCKCFCFPKSKFLKILQKNSAFKEIFQDNSFQNYKAVNLALVKNLKIQLSAEKGRNVSLNEALNLFRTQILITAFKKINKEKETRKNLNILDRNTMPKETLKVELCNMKTVLEDLREINKKWLRYF